MIEKSSYFYRILQQICFILMKKFQIQNLDILPWQLASKCKKTRHCECIRGWFSFHIINMAENNKLPCLFLLRSIDENIGIGFNIGNWDNSSWGAVLSA